MNATDDRAGFLDEVLAIAVEAGQRILEVYNRPDFDVTAKGDGSPLTAADRVAHEHIVRRLGALSPVLPVLSEESVEGEAAGRASWSRFWLVDPLDGTKEFLKRNGEFTVNIALVDRERPVMGVVYVPVTGDAYLARSGEGAWKQHEGERRPIRVRPFRGGKATVVASRSHSGPEVERYLQRLKAREGDYETASMGSSLKLCLVAEGAADVYPRLGLTSEWDTAAAQCVVEAAGGRVTNLEGRPLVYNKANILNPWFLAIGDASYDWRAFLDRDGPAG